MATLVILGKFIQTPDENKRYTIDYSDWLDAGETVVGATSEIDVTSDPPLVVDSLTTNETLATWHLKGGKDGIDYKVVIAITTSAGQIKQDAIVLRCRDYTPLT